MLRFSHAQRALEDLRPYLRPLVVLSIASLLAVPMTLILPVPIKLLVDSVLGSQPLPGYLTIFVGSQVSKTLALWLAISILMAAAVLTYLQNLVNVWYSNKVGNRMTLDVRARLFRQMQRLSVAYHDTMGAADSAYRTLNDAPMLRSFGIDSLIPLTTSILALAAMILVMVYLDWQLALIALLVSPLMFLLISVFRPRIRAGWRKYRASESAAMAVAQESLGASRLVKSYGQEERKNEQLVSHYNASLSASLKVQVDSAVYSLLVGVVTAAGLAAVLYIGIGHVQAGILTLGSLLVVNYYVTQLYGPLRNVGQSILDIQMSMTGIERYHAVLDEKPDVPESPNALPLVRAKGKIAFQKESFEYTKGHPVLNDVSFELPSANCLGVVGPTGSGKTTLSTLLLRLFVHTEAAILETIQELMKGKTTLMIAHRASTLRNCNLILVLEEGRVTRITTEVDSVISGMQALNVQI